MIRYIKAIREIKWRESLGPGRYRHTNQFIDVFRMKGEEEMGLRQEISRKEAVHRLLGIMKKLGLSWQRKPQTLPGWRMNSL